METSPSNADRLEEKTGNNTPDMMITGFAVAYNDKCRGAQWKKPKQLLIKEMRRLSNTTFYILRVSQVYSGDGILMAQHRRAGRLVDRCNEDLSHGTVFLQ